MIATQSVNSLFDQPSTKAAPPLSRFAQRYREWLARRPKVGVLIPSVQKLLDSGKLHLFDSEWIARLLPESQLRAAQKCMRPSVTFLPCHGGPERSTITHGSGGGSGWGATG